MLKMWFSEHAHLLCCLWQNKYLLKVSTVTLKIAIKSAPNPPESFA